MRNTKNKLHKFLDKYNENKFIIVEGFDEAVIGVINGEYIAYSLKKTIEIIMNELKISKDQAFEYFHFNLDIDEENYPFFVDDIH